jgi:polyisoprenoid-binding protein YceI
MLPGPALPPLPGSSLFAVDDGASSVRLRVYRDGPMAALGHNHVLRPRGVSGSIQLHEDPARSRVALQFPVAGIEVDDPALRAAAGADFSSEITAGGRAGTQQHMLGELVLDAARFPVVTLRSESIARLPDGAGLRLAMRITVHGRDAVVDVPLRWRRQGDVLSVQGEFSVLQSQFGMTPYSAMLGALRVGDRIDIDFDLVARRVRP